MHPTASRATDVADNEAIPPDAVTDYASAEKVVPIERRRKPIWQDFLFLPFDEGVFL